VAASQVKEKRFAQSRTDNDAEELKRENESLKSRRTELSASIEAANKTLNKTNLDITRMQEDIKEATDRLELKTKDHMQEIMQVEETQNLTEELERIREELEK
jgi:chromosome segregation ATPase